jgi:AcrR family transcriptional regulator
LARIKSEDKRNAILDAATRVFAEQGLSAATAGISRAAGIAEGTLFTYFKTKDELLNALYCDIKLSLADAMMSGFPRRKSVRARLEHVWNHYITWGIQNPLQQRVLRQVEVWNGLTSESKQAGMAPFVEIETMMVEAEKQRLVKDLPGRFVQAAMSALAEMTMELIRQDPDGGDEYQKAGFAMFWAGTARH